MASPIAYLDLDAQTDVFRKLEHRFPSLVSFNRGYRTNLRDRGSEAIRKSIPDAFDGRVGVLEFRENGVKFEPLDSEYKLDQYMRASKTGSSHCHNRLYLLQDIPPHLINRFGSHLNMSPVIFGEFLNTWHYTDVYGISQRTLPSLTNATTSFTLKYYEVRSRCSDLGRHRTTVNVARRRFEPWREIPIGEDGVEREGVGLIRRNISFWSRTNELGWDSLLIVDPPLDPDLSGKYLVLGNYYSPPTVSKHSSRPYHGGYSDLAPWDSHSTTLTSDDLSGPPQTSIFNDIVHYWTKIATPNQIHSAIQTPVETTYHINKIISCHWGNLLDLISFTLTQIEYFSSRKDQFLSTAANNTAWRVQLSDLKDKWRSLDTFRRRLMWYQDELDLNLERLGAPRDGGGSSSSRRPESRALSDAILDLEVVAERLKTYRERAENLTGLVTDLVSLRSAIKSLDDGAFGLRLSVIATIVFPMTLVVAIFSMTDGYAPGDTEFWLPFVVSVPLVLGTLVFLLLGDRLWKWVLGIRSLRLRTRDGKRETKGRA